MYRDKKFKPEIESLACADNKQEFRSSELANLSTKEINRKGINIKSFICVLSKTNTKTKTHIVS